VLTSLPFNPALGVLRQQSAARALALCARTGTPLVLNDAASPARVALAARPKPKKLKGTVVLVIEQVGGIGSGTIKVGEAKCPSGYSVFAGSHAIADSALAHTSSASVRSKRNSYAATVVNPPASINAGIPRSTAKLTVGALCAKRGKPIVINGAFPRR
jgi:hypothetical protein